MTIGLGKTAYTPCITTATFFFVTSLVKQETCLNRNW